ncbi:MAG: Lactoylglutathione lyase [Ramlibacter sp.]|jgi:hypothetical protein|nr:Lactoylglutathione lyase [Ramlibacter sp.]
MDNLDVIELKAFVPAKDFALSKRFYADFGFTQRSEGGGVAYFSCGSAAFLLQDYYLQEFADNCVMHLLVRDVHAWRRRVMDADLPGRYGVKVTETTEQPWGITEFVVIDPAGVCWHVGQNTPGFRRV